MLSPDTSGDRDGDGLGNLSEAVVGTDPLKAVTAGSNIPDGLKLEQGLDPLAGAAFPTGTIASLPLQGAATAVDVEGSTSASGSQTAFVATGPYGLAVVDASQPGKPTVLSQIRLTGDSTDVAVDPNLDIAAVASGPGGLNLVDVSDPKAPKLIRTVPASATQVEVFDGIAYAAVGGDIESFDLETGGQLQDLTLGSGTITGMARVGNTIYTIDSAAVLRAINLSGLQMVAEGSLQMPDGDGNLSVVNGVAYVAATLSPYGGYETVNLADPNHLVFVAPSSASQASAVPNPSVAATGSGIVLATVWGRGIAPRLDVFSESDPGNTGAFLTSFPLPQTASAVTVARGAAYIADGLGGLQVVSYLPLDTGGIPPTASISTTATNLSPNGPGFSVLEGSIIPIQANVSDDVQVRNVELLLNGQLVENAVSPPYNLSVTLPTLASGATAATIQVKAFDSGGNVAVSNTLTLQLARSPVPPVVSVIDPAPGGTLPDRFRTIQIGFSEGLNPATVNASNFYLTEPDGTIVSPSQIQLAANSSVAQITVPAPPAAGWPEGQWSVVIHSAAVADRAGNVMGSADYISQFRVAHYTATWIGPTTGDWGTASNWSGGVVPGNGNSVFIPAGDTVVYSSGTIDLDSIVCAGNLTIAGGLLFVAAPSSLSGTLALSGGTLSLPAGASLTVTGSMAWGRGTVSGAGTLTVGPAATLAVGSIYAEILSGVTLENDGAATYNGILYLEGGATFLNRGSLTASPYDASGGRGEIDGTAGGGAFDNAGTFTCAGPGAVVFSGAAFNNTGTVIATGGTLSIPSPGTNTGTYTVAPGASVQINGNFTNGPGGTVVVQIAGNSVGQFGTVVVGGTASLGGTLQLQLSGGFVPSAGQTFSILSASSVTGAFSTVSGTSLPNGRRFQVQYNPTSVALLAV